MESAQQDIRPYCPEDAQQLTDILYAAVHKTPGNEYTAAQRRAWAPLPPDYAAWKNRFENLAPFIAEISGHIAGFITLENDGHIDLAYVHHNYQRQGVASALYAYAESRAKQMGLTRLFVEASHWARPFFKKQGFQVLHANEIKRQGEVLINWSMEKRLIANKKPAQDIGFKR